MESFIFNDFKKRLIEGEVPKDDIWTLSPVNTKFVNEYQKDIKYIKNKADLELLYYTHYSGEEEVPAYDFDFYKTKMFMNTYKYEKLQNTDVKSKPFFVTTDNFDVFLTQFPGQGHLRDLFFKPGEEFYREDHVDIGIDKDGNKERAKVPRGFYYVNTSEELLWCADKVNGKVYNNTINIVLGDNIGTVDKNITIDNIQENYFKFKRINFSIGSNPEQPYEGVFFGNGFKFVNLIIECNNNANGIFGYVGHDGYIFGAEFDGINILECAKKISLTHLTQDGNNIYAGLLCGKNNGTVTRSFIHGTVIVTEFVPKVYSTYNKTDSENETNSETNTFFPNYYCYDNPGNIVPYLGYFNEGVFATYSGIGQDNVLHLYWNTSQAVQSDFGRRYSNGSFSPMEWYYSVSTPATVKSQKDEYTYMPYFMHNTLAKNRINILWYDGNIVTEINKQASTEDRKYSLSQLSDIGLFPTDPILMNPQNNLTGAPVSYNGNFCGIYPQVTEFMKAAQYFNKSMKMSQQNRVAYYVSPLIGMNNNVVSYDVVGCRVYTSGTFVGFIGGVAGMQAKGDIHDVISIVESMDVVDTSPDTSTYFKRNYISGGDYNYCFPLKSIKNISSLFGSCVVSDNKDLSATSGPSYSAGLKLDNVKSRLVNCNNIAFVNYNLNTPVYDDYYFDNRFGAFAAMVELNSSNLDNIWNDEQSIGNSNVRCIKVDNSVFEYIEEADYTPNTKFITASLCSPYKIASQGVNGYNHDMYGVASPLFPEIKPSYLMIPSIISCLYETIGHELVSETTPPKTFHVGLYGIDQNIAAPYSNPNFWSINTEVDLPGIGIKNDGDDNQFFDGVKRSIPASILERLNNQTSTNFDLDITHLASKLISWNNTKIASHEPAIDAGYFSTIKVPFAANVESAYYALEVDENGEAIGPIYPCEGTNVPSGAYIIQPTAYNATGYPIAGTLNSYGANKVLNLYPYFGSDILLVENTATDAVDTDLTSGFKKVRLTATNLLFNCMSANIPVAFTKSGSYMQPYNNTYYSTYMPNNIREVIFEIDGEAFSYAPFTETPIPGNNIQQQITKVNEWYKASAIFSRDNGNNDRRFDDNGFGIPAVMTFSAMDQANAGLFAAYTWNQYGYSQTSPIRYGFYIQNYASTSTLLDKKDDDIYTYFIIPFEPFSAYDKDAVAGLNPPYSTFEGFYVYAIESDDRYIPGGHPTYAGICGQAAYMASGARCYMPLSAEIESKNLYFGGYSYEHYPTTAEIWVDNFPPLSCTYMTAYKYRLAEPASDKYAFIDKNDPTQITYDVNEAATGYFTTEMVATDPQYDQQYFVVQRNRVVTASDNTVYQCYGPYDGEWIEAFPFDINTMISDSIPESARMMMSAVILNNITATEWNWETPFDVRMYRAGDIGTRLHISIRSIRDGDYTNYPYYYDQARRQYKYPLVQEEMGTLIYPKQWNEMNMEGRFVNALIPSVHVPDPGITVVEPSEVDYNSAGLSLYDFNNAVSSNMVLFENTKSEEINYYMYTYTKSEPYTADMLTNYKLPVKYDYMNNKAGFWFQIPDTSGTLEFNDTINYYANVLAFGKTLNQLSILNYCLPNSTDSDWSVSGFSADDFEGLFVTDSSSRPVMYIDVGLGECTDGTTWTLSSYPSTDVTGQNSGYMLNNCYGLLMEVE